MNIVDCAEEVIGKAGKSRSLDCARDVPVPTP